MKLKRQIKLQMQRYHEQLYCQNLYKCYTEQASPTNSQITSNNYKRGGLYPPGHESMCSYHKSQSSFTYADKHLEQCQCCRYVTT